MFCFVLIWWNKMKNNNYFSHYLEINGLSWINGIFWTIGRATEQLSLSIKHVQWSKRKWKSFYFLFRQLWNCSCNRRATQTWNLVHNQCIFVSLRSCFLLTTSSKQQQQRVSQLVKGVRFMRYTLQVFQLILSNICTTFSRTSWMIFENQDMEC